LAALGEVVAVDDMIKKWCGAADYKGYGALRGAAGARHGAGARSRGSRLWPVLTAPLTPCIITRFHARCVEKKKQ
jgi:hypothetical protein